MHLSSSGYASDTMYRQRWDLIESLISADKFALIDWRSDSGWFSVTAALAFPRANIISVDGSVMLGDSNIQDHLNKIAEERLENNTLINCLFDADTFSALKQCPVQYQLALSVFHWMGDSIGRPLRNAKDWENAFLDLVRCAEVTFFEIPNEDNPNETPHRIRSWYGRRNVTDTISDALERLDGNAGFEFLGDIEHGSKGSRKLFVIRSGVRAIDAERNAEVATIIRDAGKRIKLPFSLAARLRIKKLLKSLLTNPAMV
jgi:hypothetical protein